MSNAIINGTYSDFKLVRTRGVAQVVIEVPLERASKFIEMFGVPSPSDEIHVAVARLANDAPAPEPAKRKFDDISPAQQAGMLCQDAEFKTFVHGTYVTESATELVRQFCDVQSRSEIVKDSKAHGKWELLLADFRAWQTTKKYEGTIR